MKRHIEVKTSMKHMRKKKLSFRNSLREAVPLVFVLVSVPAVVFFEALGLSNMRSRVAQQLSQGIAYSQDLPESVVSDCAQLICVSGKDLINYLLGEGYKEGEDGKSLYCKTDDGLSERIIFNPYPFGDEKSATQLIDDLALSDDGPFGVTICISGSSKLSDSQVSTADELLSQIDDARICSYDFSKGRSAACGVIHHFGYEFAVSCRFSVGDEKRQIEITVTSLSHFADCYGIEATDEGASSAILDAMASDELEPSHD